MGKFDESLHFNFYLELRSSKWISKALTEMFISQIHTHSEAANSNSAAPNIQAAMTCQVIYIKNMEMTQSSKLSMPKICMERVR